VLLLGILAYIALYMGLVAVTIAAEGL
jgi:hypothetical protein